MSMFTPVFIPVSAGVTEYGGGARAVAARKGGNTKSSKNVGDKHNADTKKGASKFSLKTFKSSKNAGDKENAGNGADAKKGGSKFSFNKFKSSKNVGDKKNAGDKAAAKSNDSKAVSAFAIPRALRSLAKRTTSKTEEKTATPIASPDNVEVQSGEKMATLIASPAQEAVGSGEKEEDKEDDVALPRVKVPISHGLAEILKSMMGHIALGMVGAGAATNGGESPATSDRASAESATPHMPGWLSTHASIHDPNSLPASFSTQAPSCYSVSYTESLADAEMVQGMQVTIDEGDAWVDEWAERRRQYDLRTSESILELKNNVGDRRQWSAEDEPTEEVRRGWIPSFLLHDAASFDAVPGCASFKTATDSASLKTATDFGSPSCLVSYATLPPLDASSSSCSSVGDSGPATPDLPGHLDFIDRDDSPVFTQKPDMTSSLSIVWDADLAELWLAADGLYFGNTIGDDLPRR